MLRGPEKGSLLKLTGTLARRRLPAGERAPATLLPAPARGDGRPPHRTLRCRPPLPSPRPRSRSPARGGGRHEDPADESPPRDKRAAAPAPGRGEAGPGLAAPLGSAPSSPSFNSPTIKHAGAGTAGWRSCFPSPGDGDNGWRGALPALNLPLAPAARPRGDAGARRPLPAPPEVSPSAAEAGTPLPGRPCVAGTVAHEQACEEAPAGASPAQGQPAA